jgi:hypothetical protein
MHLCSRWGKTESEIESIPVSEFYHHWEHWENYRWGMTDDLLAILIAHKYQGKVQPWSVKLWTTQKDYAYRITKMAIKPASAIRSGFIAVWNAVKGTMK